MKLSIPEAIPENADAYLEALGRKMEARFGFHLPKEKTNNLRRAILETAAERGVSPFACLRTLLETSSGDDALERCAIRLTVGETFFFRERKFLNAFADRVLPDIASRKKDGVRLWSAGCSTGEEPYTLSILADEMLPRLSIRNISILGSDINPLALEKAREAVYSRWSFRGVDESLIPRYFDPCGKDLYSVKETFRKSVTFVRLNLAEKAWPLWGDAIGPDVIFCRNVLLYLSPAAREDVLSRFHRILPYGGWLVVASCETSAFLSARFSPIICGDATIYRKDTTSPSALFAGAAPFSPEFKPAMNGDANRETASELMSVSPVAAQANADFVPDEERDLLPEHPQSQETRKQEEDSAPPSFDFHDIMETARNLANSGMYEAALQQVRIAHMKGKTDPIPLYLMSLLFQELGNDKDAFSALRSALFLDPGFVIAHYTMGSLALRTGKTEAANRHFRNVEELLSRVPQDHVLPESDGTTAGELLSSVRILRREVSL